MSLFNTVSMILQHNSEGYYNKGVWVDGSKIEIPFTGTFQPASGKELEILPEGKRSKSIYKIFANLNNNFTSFDDLKQLEADNIIYDGMIYQVIKVEKWNNGLIPHWEFFVERFDKENDNG